MLWIRSSLPRIKCKDNGRQKCGIFSKLGRGVCNIFWFWSFWVSTCCHQYSAHLWLWIMGLWRWTVRRLWKSNSRLQDISTLNFSTQYFKPNFFQKKINFQPLKFQQWIKREKASTQTLWKARLPNLVGAFCLSAGRWMSINVKFSLYLKNSLNLNSMASLQLHVFNQEFVVES